MTAELIEKIKTVAIYDGWEYVNDDPEDYPNGYWVNEKLREAAQLENMSFHYLENLNSLHTVAMNVMDELNAKRDNLMWMGRPERYAAINKQSDIAFACMKRPINNEYTTLFHAVYDGIAFLNSFKPQQ